MMRFRFHIAAILIAVLTLTGQGMAVTKGMSRGVSFMELCAGLKTLWVAVDEEGQPVPASHNCPECTLLALHMLADEAAPVLPATSFVQAPRPLPDTSLAAQRAPFFKARGPPLTV